MVQQARVRRKPTPVEPTQEDSPGDQGGESTQEDSPGEPTLTKRKTTTKRIYKPRPTKIKRNKQKRRRKPKRPFERGMVREMYATFKAALALRYGEDPKDPASQARAMVKWMEEDKSNSDSFFKAFLPMLVKLLPKNVSESEQEALRIAAQAEADGGASQAVNILMPPGSPVPIPNAVGPIPVVDVVPDSPPLLPMDGEDEWEDDLVGYDEDDEE